MDATHCCPEYSPATEVVDAASGDRICTRCGRVLEGHMMVSTFADVQRITEATVVDANTAGGTGFDRVPGVHRGTLAGDLARRRARHAMELVDEVGNVLRLSERTLCWARELMRDSLERHSVRGDSKLRDRAAGCLYFACKLDCVSRAEHEVADALGMARKDLQRANKTLRRLLVDRSYAREMLHGVRPASLLPRLLQNVRAALSDNAENVPWNVVRARAEALAVEVERSCALDGKKPHTVCAALLMAVLQPWAPGALSTVAHACGISPGAVETALEAVAPVATKTEKKCGGES
jgi:transcription initiation factor TFIIIB Brf1 subunit/transcription initiation factor TFIIB